MKSILLLEDDTSLGQSLFERLGQEKYQVTWVKTVLEAKNSFLTQKFDICILDLGLPDGSGFDVSRQIKTEVPVIFLTAWNTAENRLEGYELGAAEFIPKPFHFRELLLRLQHVLESHQPQKKIKLPAGTLDLEKMCFTTHSGEMTFLANRDFQVLQLLIDSSPKPISRDEILNQVWGFEAFPSHRTVDNAILRLRQSLRDENDQLIRSVRGLGYQWVYT